MQQGKQESVKRGMLLLEKQESVKRGMFFRESIGLVSVEAQADIFTRLDAFVFIPGAKPRLPFGSFFLYMKGLVKD
jgi:hypothetical protein